MSLTEKKKKNNNNKYQGNRHTKNDIVSKPTCSCFVCEREKKKNDIAVARIHRNSA